MCFVRFAEILILLGQRIAKIAVALYGIAVHFRRLTKGGEKR